MRKTINFQRNAIIFGIPLLIIGVMIFIAKSSLFQLNPDNFSIGITIDLLFIVPIIYFLLIRKTNIPKTTVVTFLILGIVICSIILPSENQYYLTLFKTWVLPILELSLLSYVIYKMRNGIKLYKLEKDGSYDFFTTLKNTCYHILPKKVVTPVVTEIAVLYYGFIYWKKRKLEENEFSYHKDSGTVALLVITIFIVVVETVVLHILLVKWSSITAWVLTIISIYSALQIFGFLKSISKRPISIEGEKLFLRYGIMNETTVDLNDIDSIEVSSKEIELTEGTRKLSVLGALESHNVVIRLKSENVLSGLYGFKKKFKTLLLHVDNKADFVSSVEAAIENPQLSKTQKKEVKVTLSLLSDKHEAIRAIVWILSISWLFGFSLFYVVSKDNQLVFGISTLVFSMLPAIIALILNRVEGGNWKSLEFRKPKLKPAILAFITPFIYFGVIIAIQLTLEIRSFPNWNKLGPVNELVLNLILGYPLMLFLIMGEEIGWRGYLQEKLINAFGGLKGLVVLGLIWGIWHLPLSLQGYNLPNNPILETLVTTPLMCVSLSIMIGYYGLNSKSIFIGLLLHTSNNHFGGTFLYLTETYNEVNHAIVFVIIYIAIIIIYSTLYRKKEDALQSSRRLRLK